MSSPSLAVVSRFHPDHVRVAGLSAAIALNLLVLLLALRPLEPAVMQAIKVPSALRVTWQEPPPAPVPPPPPIELKPLPAPVAPPAVPMQPRPAPPPAATPVENGTQAVPPATMPTLAPPQAPVAAAPPEASLAYVDAPLRFPTEAIRRHLHGTVLLRVLVDEDGKPLAVAIEKSSGSRLLDQSARSQVLSGWRFQPAMADGRRIRAYARVPVTFALRDL